MATCRDCKHLGKLVREDRYECDAPIPKCIDVMDINLVFLDDHEYCPCHKPIVAVPEKVG